MNPSRFNKRRIDAEQLAFETKIRFARDDPQVSYLVPFYKTSKTKTSRVDSHGQT